MPKYFVHRYDVIRVKVAVEAASQKAAMEAADEYLSKHHPIQNRYLGGAGEDEALAESVGLPTWIQYEEPGQEITGYLVDEFDDADCEKSREYDKNSQPVLASGWDDHPDHPREDWKTEVDNDDTFLGYPEWVSQQLVCAAEEAASEGTL